MTIDFKWTPEKKEAVIKKIEEWIIKNGGTAGEIIMQSDRCIISAPVLLSDLVDDIIQPDVDYEDED